MADGAHPKSSKADKSHEIDDERNDNKHFFQSKQLAKSSKSCAAKPSLPPRPPGLCLKHPAKKSTAPMQSAHSSMVHNKENKESHLTQRPKRPPLPSNQIDIRSHEICGQEKETEVLIEPEKTFKSNETSSQMEDGVLTKTANRMECAESSGKTQVTKTKSSHEICSSDIKPTDNFTSEGNSQTTAEPQTIPATSLPSGTSESQGQDETKMLRPKRPEKPKSPQIQTRSHVLPPEKPKQTVLTSSKVTRTFDTSEEKELPIVHEESQKPIPEKPKQPEVTKDSHHDKPKTLDISKTIISPGTKPRVPKSPKSAPPVPAKPESPRALRTPRSSTSPSSVPQKSKPPVHAKPSKVPSPTKPKSQEPPKLHDKLVKGEESVTLERKESTAQDELDEIRNVEHETCSSSIVTKDSPSAVECNANNVFHEGHDNCNDRTSSEQAEKQKSLERAEASRVEGTSGSEKLNSPRLTREVNESSVNMELTKKDKKPARPRAPSRKNEEITEVDSSSHSETVPAKPVRAPDSTHSVSSTCEETEKGDITKSTEIADDHKAVSSKILPSPKPCRPSRPKFRVESRTKSNGMKNKSNFFVGELGTLSQASVASAKPEKPEKPRPPRNIVTKTEEEETHVTSLGVNSSQVVEDMSNKKRNTSNKPSRPVEPRIHVRKNEHHGEPERSTKVQTFELESEKFLSKDGDGSPSLKKSVSSKPLRPPQPAVKETEVSTTQNMSSDRKSTFYALSEDVSEQNKLGRPPRPTPPHVVYESEPASVDRAESLEKTQARQTLQKFLHDHQQAQHSGLTRREETAGVAPHNAGEVKLLNNPQKPPRAISQNSEKPLQPCDTASTESVEIAKERKDKKSEIERPLDLREVDEDFNGSSTNCGSSDSFHFNSEDNETVTTSQTSKPCKVVTPPPSLSGTCPETKTNSKLCEKQCCGDEDVGRDSNENKITTCMPGEKTFNCTSEKVDGTLKDKENLKSSESPKPCTAVRPPPPKRSDSEKESEKIVSDVAVIVKRRSKEGKKTEKEYGETTNERHSVRFRVSSLTKTEVESFNKRDFLEKLKKGENDRVRKPSEEGEEGVEPGKSKPKKKPAPSPKTENIENGNESQLEGKATLEDSNTEEPGTKGNLVIGDEIIHRTNDEEVCAVTMVTAKQGTETVEEVFDTENKCSSVGPDNDEDCVTQKTGGEKDSVVSEKDADCRKVKRRAPPAPVDPVEGCGSDGNNEDKTSTELSNQKMGRIGSLDAESYLLKDEEHCKEANTNMIDDLTVKSDLYVDKYLAVLTSASQMESVETQMPEQPSSFREEQPVTLDSELRISKETEQVEEQNDLTLKGRERSVEVCPPECLVSFKEGDVDLLSGEQNSGKTETGENVKNCKSPVDVQGDVDKSVNQENVIVKRVHQGTSQESGDIRITLNVTSSASTLIVEQERPTVFSEEEKEVAESCANDSKESVKTEKDDVASEKSLSDTLMADLSLQLDVNADKDQIQEKACNTQEKWGKPAVKEVPAFSENEPTIVAEGSEAFVTEVEKDEKDDVSVTNVTQSPKKNKIPPPKPKRTSSLKRESKFTPPKVAPVSKETSVENLPEVKSPGGSLNEIPEEKTERKPAPAKQDTSGVASTQSIQAPKRPLTPSPKAIRANDCKKKVIAESASTSVGRSDSFLSRTKENSDRAVVGTGDKDERQSGGDGLVRSFSFGGKMKWGKSQPLRPRPPTFYLDESRNDEIKKEILVDDEAENLSKPESCVKNLSESNEDIVEAESSQNETKHDSVLTTDSESEGDKEDVPQKSKTYYISREILTTERTFVDAVKLVSEDFKEAVNSGSTKLGRAIIPDDVLQDIMLNISQIYDFDKEFLKALEDRMQTWEEQQRIGDIIKRFSPFLKMYKTYIQGYDNAMAVLTEALKKYQQFAEVVREFETSERCQNLTVGMYMLKPIQRIPSYRLLLIDYLKHLSKDSLDYKDVSDALAIVSDVATHINEDMKRVDNFEEVLKVQRSLVGQVEIVKPGRELIKEGALMKLCRKDMQPRMFYLFTDVLLYTTPVANNQFRLNLSLPLEEIKVELPVSPDFDNEFSIISTKKSFILSASTAEERDEWLEALRNASDEIRKKKITFHLAKKEKMEALYDARQGDEDKNGKLGSKAPVWIPDVRVTMCMLCTDDFTVTNRRHHCRACGKVICGSCSSNSAPLAYLNHETARVCDVCYDELTDTTPNSGKTAASIENGNTPDKHCPPKINTHVRKTKKNSKFKSKEVPAVEESTISGYLKTRVGKKWHKRWYVVKDNVLYASKASSDIAAQETRPLLGYDVRGPDEMDGNDKKIVFQLIHAGTEPVVLQTDNLKSAERWVNALRRATILPL